MKIAIFGAGGQLGQALAQELEGRHDLSLVMHSEVDISDRSAVRAALDKLRPAVVLNAAAVTDVDGCERDPRAAYLINALGPRWLAEGSNALGALLVHVSTDYVFPGRDGGCYHEWDKTDPIQEYGRTKLAGEHEVRTIAARHMIVRTSWLYGGPERGFVRAILSRARQGQPLRVASDQVGSPSYTRDVAAGIANLVSQGVVGTVHLGNAGRVSRHGFAEEILRQAGVEGPVETISSTEVPAGATRPRDTSIISWVAPRLGIRMRPWEEALGNFLMEE